MLTSIEGIYENGHIHLLETLPNIKRARVVVTVLPDTPPIAFATPATETLGQQLRALRGLAIAKGMPLLDQDAILEEVRQRRGEDA